MNDDAQVGAPVTTSAWYSAETFAPVDAHPVAPPLGKSVFQSTQPPRTAAPPAVFSSMVPYRIDHPGALRPAAGAMAEVITPLAFAVVLVTSTSRDSLSRLSS